MSLLDAWLFQGLPEFYQLDCEGLLWEVWVAPGHRRSQSLFIKVAHQTAYQWLSNTI